MDTFRIMLLGEPKPKQRPRTIRRGRFVHTYNPRTTAYTTYLTQIIQLSPKEPFKGALAVEMVFYLPKGKSVKRSLPCVGSDLDNLVKEVSDLCNKRLWNDDSQICRLVLTKLYADSPDQCRTIITINQMIDN